MPRTRSNREPVPVSNAVPPIYTDPQPQPPRPSTPNQPPNLTIPSPTQSSSSASPSTSSNTPRPRQDYRYVLRSIPKTITSQKVLFNTLKPLRLDLVSLKMNHNATALIETAKPLPADTQKSLQHLLGDPATTITALGQPKPPTTRRPPSYSCVIRHVDFDITDDDIITAIALPTVSKVWRITSKQTNRPTTLIRVLTPSKTTLDFLLTHGVYMFGRHYSTEPPKFPSPLPKYCATCTKIGHMSEECPSRQVICPKCGQSHHSQSCKSDEPKCNNCGGPHPTYSFHCPKRTETPTLPEEIAPIRPVDTTTSTIYSETSEPADRFCKTTRFIKVLTTVLLRVFPNDRQRIAKALDISTKTYLNHRTMINFHGSMVHVSVTPVPR